MTTPRALTFAALAAALLAPPFPAAAPVRSLDRDAGRVGNAPIRFMNEAMIIEIPGALRATCPSPNGD